MNVISALLPATASVADVEKLLAEHPRVAEHFDRLRSDRSNKARSRAPLERVYSAAVVDFLLPRLALGRPTYAGVFPLLTSPVRVAIADALGAPIDEIDWTIEAAALASDVIEARYVNPRSAATALKFLRAGIGQALGLDAVAMKTSPVIGATLREVAQPRLDVEPRQIAARIGDDIELPQPYATLAALEARARDFIAEVEPAATPQAAADLLVLISARPGENAPIKIGDRGAISGNLKKTANGSLAPYNIVSAVGEHLVIAYLKAWGALSMGSKRAAMAALPRLAATWGLHRCDLCAIGTALALPRDPAPA